MASSVRTFLPVAGEPRALAAAFEGDPQAWLPDPRRDGRGDHWTIPVHAGSLTHTVRAHVGATWRSGTTQWRAVTWDPAGDDSDPAAAERLLPSFDGELGLHVLDDDRVTLILDGWYRPPGGVLGSAADAVGLRRVARATMMRFLTDVAARLSAEAVLQPGDGTDTGQSAAARDALNN